MIELGFEYLSLRWNLLYVNIMSRRRFRVNPHYVASWMSRNSLDNNEKNYFSDLSDSNEFCTHIHLIRKHALNHLHNLVKWLSCVVHTFLDGVPDSIFLSFHVRVS